MVSKVNHVYYQLGHVWKIMDPELKPFGEYSLSYLCCKQCQSVYNTCPPRMQMNADKVI